MKCLYVKLVLHLKVSNSNYIKPEYILIYFYLVNEEYIMNRHRHNQYLDKAQLKLIMIHYEKQIDSRLLKITFKK